MNSGVGKVDIDRSDAIGALQVTPLHNIVTLGIGRTKVPFKTNIIHRLVGMRGQRFLPRPPFSSPVQDFYFS